MSMFEMMADLQNALAFFQDDAKRNEIVAKFTGPLEAIVTRLTAIERQLSVLDIGQQHEQERHNFMLDVLATMNPEAFDKVLADNEAEEADDGN